MSESLMFACWPARSRSAQDSKTNHTTCHREQKLALWHHCLHWSSMLRVQKEPQATQTPLHAALCWHHQSSRCPVSRHTLLITYSLALPASPQMISDNRQLQSPPQHSAPLGICHTCWQPQAFRGLEGGRRPRPAYSADTPTKFWHTHWSTAAWGATMSLP